MIETNIKYELTASLLQSCKSQFVGTDGIHCKWPTQLQTHDKQLRLMGLFTRRLSWVCTCAGHFQWIPTVPTHLVSRYRSYYSCGRRSTVQKVRKRCRMVFRAMYQPWQREFRAHEKSRAFLDPGLLSFSSAKVWRFAWCPKVDQVTRRQSHHTSVVLEIINYTQHFHISQTRQSLNQNNSTVIVARVHNYKRDPIVHATHKLIENKFGLINGCYTFQIPHFGRCVKVRIICMLVELVPIGIPW